MAISTTDIAQRLTTAPILDAPSELPKTLRLNATALLILSNKEIEGTLIGYGSFDRHSFEVTIHSKDV